MAATEHVDIVELGVGDAPAGLVLSTEAHWNQNEADWRFFLSEGIVFGVRDGDGIWSRRAALLPYSAGNAWISMVLVTANWRRRGLATRLVDACLDAAAQARPDHLARRDAGRRHGLWPARLHADAAIAAAAAGEAARRQGGKRRYRPAASTPSLARDRRAMGFDRSTLLAEFGGRPGSRLVSNGEAMALVRDGRTARHIGPLFADRADAGAGAGR